MGHFSIDGLAEEVPGHSHAGDGSKLIDRYRCCSGNGLVRGGAGERYMT